LSLAVFDVQHKSNLLHNQAMKKYLILASVCLILQGCNSVQTSVALSRLQSPETRGDSLKFAGELGYGATTDIQVVLDASTRPPAINTPAKMSTGNELYTKIILDVLPWLDLDLRDAIFNYTPAVLTAKAQVLGQHSKESKDGNFSLSFAGAVGGTSLYKSGSQLGAFGPGGYSWNVDLTTTMQSLAVISGYRFNSSLLLYGGFFRDTDYASGTIHQATSDNGQSPAAQYSIGGDAINLGGNLDLEIALNNTHMAFLTLELERSVEFPR
jgi:hypothetical protein